MGTGDGLLAPGEISGTELTELNNITENNLNSKLERKYSEQSQQPSQLYLSNAMQQLRQAVQDDNKRLFQQIAYNSDVIDSEENLMILYIAVIYMNDLLAFNHILTRNNFFRIRSEWAALLKNAEIFKLIQKSPECSQERLQLDKIVLKASLDKEVSFITDLVLSRAVITPEIICILFQENQLRLIVQMVLKTIPSLYKPPSYSKKKILKGARLMDQRTLHFYDVVESALHTGVKSQTVIEVLKLMQLELEKAGGPPVADVHKVDRQNMTDAEYISSELDYTELFGLFVSRRKIRLLRYLFNLPVEQFKQDHVRLFKLTLEMEAFDVAALIHKEFFRLLRDAQKADEEIILNQLVTGFSKQNGMVDFKCYLIRQHIERLQLRHASRLLEYLDIKVMSRNKSNILVLNLNVVKTSCLLIEMLHSLGSRFQSLEVRCQQIRQKIIQITEEYMNKVEQEEEMKFLLLEKDFEHRDSLDLITEYYIEEFLFSQHAENVVREIWRSSYATQDSIFTASTNHMLTFHYWHCIRDEEKEYPWCYVKHPSELESHPMQFTVWRYSPKARMGVEFLVTLAFAIAIHFMIQSVIDQQQIVQKQWLYYLDLQKELKDMPSTPAAAWVAQNTTVNTYYKLIYPEMNSFFLLMMNITYVSFCILFFALQHIPEIIYTSITKRVFNPYAFKNLLDFLIFVLFMINIWITYYVNLNGTWKERLHLKNEYRMNVFLTNYSTGHPQRETWLLIFCSISLWIRVVFLLRYNEYLGKITGVLEKMAYDLVIYFVFFLIEILFFTFIAEQSFRRIPEYSTTLSSFRTLFYSSFGQFDFGIVRQSEYGEYFGVSFLVIFLVVNIGLFMSFFISIITVLYGAFGDHQNVHHMLQTLKTRPVTKADRDYSALISIPPPLNVTLLVLAPFLLTSKNPEMWNRVILWVAYLPILILTSTLFLIYTVALFPVTYVKLVFHKLVMIFVYSKSYRVTKADKFMVWILFVIIGLPRLALNVFTDYAAFLRHLVVTDLKKTKVSIRQKPFSKHALTQLGGYLEVRSERMMPFKQVAVENRELLEIFQKLRQFLLPVSSSFIKGNSMALATAPSSVILEMQQKELNPIYEKIKEYGTLKHILDNNSQIVLVNHSKVKSIDCKMLSVLVLDACRQNSISKINDENYIFIRRAVSVKQEAAKQKKIAQRAKMGQDALDYLENQGLTNYDLERKLEAEKRCKRVVAKLIYLKTSRLLKILGYQTTENDSKRLNYALTFFSKSKMNGINNKIEQDVRNSIISNPSQTKLESQVKELTDGLPKLDNQLQSMKDQIKILVESLQKGQARCVNLFSLKVDERRSLEQLLQKIVGLKQDQNDQPFVLNTDKTSKMDENVIQSPIKPVKKVALKDLRQKGMNKKGYVSAGDDSDVPYMSDNNV